MAVRPADERSEGTAKRREDQSERGRCQPAAIPEFAAKPSLLSSPGTMASPQRCGCPCAAAEAAPFNCFIAFSLKISRCCEVRSWWVPLAFDFSGNTKVREQAGSAPERAIRSAERREEARIRPHGRGRKSQPGQDGPSVAVRPADERSEGTAKRREDRPNGGAASQRNFRSCKQLSFTAQLADERSEGTATRREDRPSGGAASQR